MSSVGLPNPPNQIDPRLWIKWESIQVLFCPATGVFEICATNKMIDKCPQLWKQGKIVAFAFGIGDAYFTTLLTGKTCAQRHVFVAHCLNWENVNNFFKKNLEEYKSIVQR